MKRRRKREKSNEEKKKQKKPKKLTQNYADSRNFKKEQTLKH